MNFEIYQSNNTGVLSARNFLVPTLRNQTDY